MLIWKINSLYDEKLRLSKELKVNLLKDYFLREEKAIGKQLKCQSQDKCVK